MGPDLGEAWPPCAYPGLADLRFLAAPQDCKNREGVLAFVSTCRFSEMNTYYNLNSVFPPPLLTGGGVLLGLTTRLQCRYISELLFSAVYANTRKEKELDTPTPFPTISTVWSAGFGHLLTIRATDAVSSGAVGSFSHKASERFLTRR